MNQYNFLHFPKIKSRAGHDRGGELGNNRRMLFARGFAASENDDSENLASCAGVSQEILVPVTLRRQHSDPEQVLPRGSESKEDKNNSDESKEQDTQRGEKPLVSKQKLISIDDNMIRTRREQDIFEKRSSLVGFPPLPVRPEVQSTDSTRDFIDGLAFLAPNRKASIERMVK